MSFKPSSDWIDAFPEDAGTVPPHLPPARPRTRRPPEPESEVTFEHQQRSGHDPRDIPLSAADPLICAASHESDAVPHAGDEPVDGEGPDTDEGNAAGYAVGYRKPPKHTRFKPGQSGNPKGRPRRAKGLNTIVRENLTSKVAVRTPTGEKRISRMEAVVHKTVEQAMKGNHRAIAELLKLYASAVPDEKISDETAGQHEDLTATDLAMLEAYRRRLGQQAGDRP
jgi:hypothetical protein